MKMIPKTRCGCVWRAIIERAWIVPIKYEYINTHTHTYKHIYIYIHTYSAKSKPAKKEKNDLFGASDSEQDMFSEQGEVCIFVGKGRGG